MEIDRQQDELELLAIRLNKLLKDLNTDDKRMDIIERLVLDGICPLCGSLYLPCYCAPQYDI